MKNKIHPDLINHFSNLPNLWVSRHASNCMAARFASTNNILWSNKWSVVNVYPSFTYVHFVKMALGGSPYIIVYDGMYSTVCVFSMQKGKGEQRAFFILQSLRRRGINWSSGHNIWIWGNKKFFPKRLNAIIIRTTL